MAHFVPTVPPSGIPYSELLTWRALDLLDDRWRVFHSVSWQSRRKGHQGDGEADFVLVHPAYGVAVLEVKGGEEVGVDRGGWYTRPHRSTTTKRIKNPYEQATDSKHTLLGRLNDLGLDRVPPVLHAVVFPNGDVKADIGLYGGPGTTITERDLLAMPDAIARVVAHWGERTELTPQDVKSICDLLAPTTVIRSRLRFKVDRTESELLKLTEQQIIAVDGLRRNRRVLITGGPGTGKTVIGAHRAQSLAAEGLSVLLTCYNKPLANKLAAELTESSVTTRTFHSLCEQQAHKAGIEVPAEPSQDWWNTEAADVLLEAAQETGLQFDAVVIDEGQDFPPNWFASLELLLRSQSDGFLLVLADPEQSIYRDGWEGVTGLHDYVLDVNCRSSLPIVKRVSGVYGTELSGIGTEGHEPDYLVATGSDETFEKVQQAVARLIDDEYLKPSSITVLCATNSLVERFRGSATGSAIFTKPGEEGVAVETIHRFKGLESEAVVLCLDGLQLDMAQGRSLVYVGLSRARSLLLVVGTKEDKRKINW